MNYIDNIKLAAAGVSGNKFRSFLTLLGIIIGVGAVILMVSLGSGTQNVISGQFNELMTRQIFIFPNWELSYRDRGQLAPGDETYLEEAALGITDITPFYRGYARVKFGEKEVDNGIAGVLPGSLDITNLNLEYGREISAADVKNRERVAVVGRRVLENLTDSKDYSSLIGEEISVNGNRLLIVGILGVSNSTIALPNNIVMLPQSTYQELMRQQARYFDFFLVSYAGDASEQDTVAEIKYLLNKKYGTSRGESRFLIEGLQGQVDIINQVIQVLTYVLGGIAAISLIVGGIGVMNIMLVTVKERTREIGVRMAIGASRGDIQRQFLMEAVFLTIGGGLLGVICGTGLSAVLNLVLGNMFEWWQGSIPIWVIGLSFGVTVFIGLTFGFYPAYKASRLDPIEALRYE